MSNDCLFCRIVAGELLADIIYESETALAFRDINPQAPNHVLVIPRKHISTINDIALEDETLVGSHTSARTRRQDADLAARVVSTALRTVAR
jgi:histidine triad (HIT) family protein